MFIGAGLIDDVMLSGATQALWVGDLATREIMGWPVEDLAYFRPTRFAAAVAAQV
jgi:hypothetical protein